MARPSVGSQVKGAVEALLDKSAGKAAPAFASERPRPTNLRLTQVELDPTQPRKDVGDISDLVSSISTHGLINALVVEQVDSKRFRLIAGERRFRACKQAGLKVVPAIVRTVEDQQRLELQLIENLHRKNLDPFEESAGYQRLMEEFSLTQAQVAQSMGKSRTHVTQTLSLASIPEEVRVRCQSSDIPLSRETLYLIAKQSVIEKMLEILQDSQSGRPFEERRQRARKGAARTTTPKKPKEVYSTNHGVTVIVQSLSEELDREQSIEGLKEALQKAQGQG